MDLWAVAGDSGTILTTIDGGTTWTRSPSNTAQNLCKVKFSDANHGWAVGFGGTILRTTRWAMKLLC